MSFDFNPIYLLWLCIGLSAALTIEAFYLLCFSTASYRSQINRRLTLAKDRVDRESVLVALRRERGLSTQGNYRLYLHAFNQLVLQSGITIGLRRLIVAITLTGVVAFVATLVFRSSVLEATIGAALTAIALPYLILRMSTRISATEIQRPISRRDRHNRAQPARRASGACRDRDGGPRDGRSHWQ